MYVNNAKKNIPKVGSEPTGTDSPNNGPAKHNHVVTINGPARNKNHGRHCPHLP